MVTASQIVNALQTIANNISNAGTAGYHRQEVRLQPRTPVTLSGLTFGTGVDVARIDRIVDESIEKSLVQNRSLVTGAESRLDIWQQIESILQPGDGSLDAAAGNLFTALSALASQPGETVLTTQVLHAASSLARGVNRTVASLDLLTQNVIRDLKAAIAEVNRLTEELSTLDSAIRHELARGRQPNTLLDRRGELLTELAGYVDLDPRSLDIPGGPVLAAGGALIVSHQSSPLTLQQISPHEVRLQTEDGIPVFPNSGRLAGLASALDDIRATRKEIVEWFEDLRTGLDHVQATGLGTSGPFTRLSSTRPLASTSVPLESLDLPIPIHSGELAVTVTDTSTQQRTTHRIVVDTGIHSLADVVAQLDAVPGITAFLDPATGHLSLRSKTGYAFDFAGRLDPTPESSTVTGTATSSIRGTFTGASNRRLNVTALDSGTIGVTQPLRLEVRDADTGAFITTIDAGLGYEPGTPLDLGNGVQLAWSAGSLNTADSLTISAVANPDETGLLAALGINSFFSGRFPGEYAVASDLLSGSRSLASSQSGAAGDSSNIVRLLEVRNNPSGQSETIDSRLPNLVALVGLEVQSTQTETAQIQSVDAGLHQQRDSLSGVDPNEELLLMLQFQQSFQSAARFVSSVNETMQDLLLLIR